MPATLALHQRYEIVFLHCHEHGPKWGVRRIAEHLKCSISTVQYWICQYEKDKNLCDKPKEGRPKKTTDKEDTFILSIATKPAVHTSTDIQKILEERRVNLSTRTIQRRLCDAQWRYSNPLLKPLLTEDHRQKRLTWAQKYSNNDWSRVIFTDETTFYLHGYIRKTWQSKYCRKVHHTVKHPVKLNVWGAFTFQGFGEIICFTHNLNAEFMCTIYERGLMPTASRYFSVNHKPWVLQEDNDPKHTSRLAKQWKQNHHVDRMDWPSMSPDLNPIENVWSLLKLRMAKRRIKTLFGLKAAVVKEWMTLSKEYAEKLAQSMESRVVSTILRNGDFTLY